VTLARGQCNLSSCCAHGILGVKKAAGSVVSREVWQRTVDYSSVQQWVVTLSFCLIRRWLVENDLILGFRGIPPSSLSQVRFLLSVVV
jgi:hypothetical protein